MEWLRRLFKKAEPEPTLEDLQREWAKFRDRFGGEWEKQQQERDVLHDKKMAALQTAIKMRRNKQDPMPCLREANKYAILGHQYDKAVVAGVRLSKPKDHAQTGPQCDAITGRIYTFEEALQETRVPCKPHCVCHWEAVFHDELS